MSCVVLHIHMPFLSITAVASCGIVVQPFTAHHKYFIFSSKANNPLNDILARFVNTINTFSKLKVKLSAKCFTSTYNVSHYWELGIQDVF